MRFKGVIWKIIPFTPSYLELCSDKGLFCLRPCVAVVTLVYWSLHTNEMSGYQMCRVTGNESKDSLDKFYFLMCVIVQ